MLSCTYALDGTPVHADKSMTQVTLFAVKPDTFYIHGMTVYTCPHHPEIEQDQPGTCPKCGGMELVPKESVAKKDSGHPRKSGLAEYKPLGIIVGLIALGALSAAWQGSAFDWLQAMQYFMAGFFFVFSGFKLLDLKGFAQGYAQYDLLAKYWHGYGFIYPFIELGLGLAYVLMPAEPVLHLVTMGVMVFGGIGVSIKIAKKEQFQCACLGTFIDVPLTYVTVLEDFGMAIMAAGMLLLA